MELNSDGDPASPHVERGMESGLVEIVDGATVWRFDEAFLTSNWTCIWGRGCLGIAPEAAEEEMLGCCSLGAHIADDEEARRISALAETLDPEMFQFREAARTGGLFTETGTATRVVEGACVFLNRPGFAGGAGCALHLAALADDESPMDWKPIVCWQLPIRADHQRDEDDAIEVTTVRPWNRRDWGEDPDDPANGVEPMAWCCTEGDRAHVGDRPVVETLAEELDALVGTEVYVELRRRLTGTTIDR